jgi:hypothetical protein
MNELFFNQPDRRKRCLRNQHATMTLYSSVNPFFIHSGRVTAIARTALKTVTVK